MSVILIKIRKNMKKVILAAIALTVSALTMSVSAAVLHDRDDVHEDRNVKNFHKVVVEGGYDVHYQQSNTVSVRLVGEQKEIDRVSVSSDGTTLKITRNKKASGLFSFSKDDDFRYLYHLTRLNLGCCKWLWRFQSTRKNRLR